MKPLLRWFAILVWFLSACNILPSPDPSSVGSVTGPGRCSQTSDRAVGTPIVPDLASKRIAVLIDKSGSFKDYTHPSVEILQDSLPEILSPSDSLSIDWIGSDPVNSQIFNGTVPSVAALQLDDFVMPTDQPTVALPPNDSSTIDTVRQIMQSTATAVVTQNERARADAHCALLAWQSQNALKWENWNQHRNIVVNEFINMVQVRVIDALTNMEYTSESRIYEGIYNSAKALSSTDPHAKKKLIIFSDMEDAIDQSLDGREAVHIDLANVDVVIAMVPCKTTVECQDKEEHWTKTINGYGARSINFLLIPNMSIEAFIRLVRS